jgi:hypothetical protein
MNMSIAHSAIFSIESEIQLSIYGIPHTTIPKHGLVDIHVANKLVKHKECKGNARLWEAVE